MAGKLLRRRDLIQLTGVNDKLIDVLLKAGVLKGVKAGGRGRNFYTPEEVERVFHVKL